MNETIAIEILKINGWSFFVDEVGDRYLEHHLGERIISIIPSITKSHSFFRIGMTPSMSTKPFSETVTQICSRSTGTSPLACMRARPAKVVTIDEATIISITEQIIDWARKIDINGEIHRHAKLPTNSKGAMPLRHLAALALLGDTEKLEMYRTSFEFGDRLDFVPYISTEMIQRALEIARTNNARLSR
ncbi:DUF6990 domain-containing protein [Pandoraea soli]